MAHGHVVFGVVFGGLVAMRGMAVPDDTALMQLNKQKNGKSYHMPAGPQSERRTNASNNQAMSTFQQNEVIKYIDFKRNFAGYKDYNEKNKRALKAGDRFMEFTADPVGVHPNDVRNGLHPELFAIREKLANSEYKDSNGHPVDHRIDMDQDGHVNAQDGDKDGDHIMDKDDAFPMNIFESRDFDGDGLGNNEELSSYGDLDGDGMVNKYDHDIDADGTVNDDDALPYDPSESGDADRDNIGDTADAFPDDARYYVDKNGDGKPDIEQTDATGNGVPDDVDN